MYRVYCEVEIPGSTEIVKDCGCFYIYCNNLIRGEETREEFWEKLYNEAAKHLAKYGHNTSEYNVDTEVYGGCIRLYYSKGEKQCTKSYS